MDECGMKKNAIKAFYIGGKAGNPDFRERGATPYVERCAPMT